VPSLGPYDDDAAGFCACARSGKVEAFKIKEDDDVQDVAKAMAVIGMDIDTIQSLVGNAVRKNQRLTFRDVSKARHALRDDRGRFTNKPKPGLPIHNATPRVIRHGLWSHGGAVADAISGAARAEALNPGPWASPSATSDASLREQGNS
jgi:hypothetical protein